MITDEKVDEIMINTSEAYSFNRFGVEAWRKSIINLNNLGYTQKEIEEILFSKFMRWAGDWYCGWVGSEEKGYEVFNGSEIVKFHNEFYNKRGYGNGRKLKV